MSKLTEHELFDKAEKLTSWDGLVYWDGAPDDLYCYTTGGDGYFESSDELLQAIVACNEDLKATPVDAIEIPDYVWCCQKYGIREFCTEDLLCDYFEDLYEDAWDYVPADAISKLDAALQEFYESTRHIVGYRPDYKKALILKQYKEDA
jgi:hypothetical protein